MVCKSKNRIKYVIISVICVICYSMTIFGGIVFDDTEAILNNKDVMTNTPLSQVFANDFWGTKMSDESSHKSYRPLTVITFRLIRHLDAFIKSKVNTNSNDLSPHLYHIFNIICYLFTNLLIFKVLVKLLNIFCPNACNQRNGFLSTVLFSCHPIHCEVVCALVGLADLLSTLWALTALLIYAEFTNNPNKYNYVSFTLNCVFVTTVCGFATLFKEQGITFLGLCVLFDMIIIFERPDTNCRQIRPRLLIYRMTGMSAGALLLLILRLSVMNFSGPHFQSGDNPTSFEKSLLTRIINYNYIYAINAWILIYPEWLCFDWSMNCISLITKVLDFRILFVILFWIISLLLLKSSIFYGNPTLRRYSFPLKFDFSDKTLIQRQTQIALSFGVIPFIPSSNLFLTVGFVVAERALFLSSIGYVLLLITGFNSLEIRFPNFSKTLQSFLIILTIILMIRTIDRNFDWMNEKQLFESGLSVCPSNAKIHYNIAKNAADSGLKQKAIDEYQEAIRLNPEYDHALNNLGNILKESGHLNQSKELLERAVKIRPSFSAAWMNLGIVQMTLNQYSEAEISYLNALKHRRRYAECYYNLGNLYVKQKRFDDAFKVWRNSTLIKPSLLSAWNNLIIMLDNIGLYERASIIALEALQHHSNESTLHFNYANVLGKMKKFNESEEQFKIAITLNPENGNYYSNLAVLYHQFQYYPKALIYYQKTLELNPNLKSAQKNLKILLKAMNQ